MPQGKGTYGSQKGRPSKKKDNSPRVKVRSTNARKKVKAAVKKLAEFSNPLLFMPKATEAAKKKMKARKK